MANEDVFSPLSEESFITSKRLKPLRKSHHRTYIFYVRILIVSIVGRTGRVKANSAYFLVLIKIVKVNFKERPTLDMALFKKCKLSL